MAHMQPRLPRNGLSREELARKLAAAFLSCKLDIPLEQAIERVPDKVSLYWLETADFVIEAAAWIDLVSPRRY
ncbi:MAG TPA: hypothetical protein VNJ09_06645 [Chthonomonadales bacterium]|jgi:hypothetical protein|nr:hypothetical protein [Chthonomonadales bacterium]